MTELEHVLKKYGTGGISACRLAHISKYSGERCSGKLCLDCEFNSNPSEIIKALLREHKEELKPTNDEKVILRSIDARFKYIARDEDGELDVYEEKPLRKCGYWQSNCGDILSLDMFKKMFLFVQYKDEEPWYIPDLLKE